jgi:hypothetical protein
MTVKMREFEARWSKLKVENNRIDGNEVKNLCKNLSQRSNLAKAWKLCCHTHSKALTKGEFFVFLELVASPNLPENLTPDMKNCIALIDQTNASTATSLKPNQPAHNTPTSSSARKMSGSNIFDNFGKSEVIVV